MGIKTNAEKKKNYVEHPCRTHSSENKTTLKVVVDYIYIGQTDYPARKTTLRTDTETVLLAVYRVN